jgi:RNA polymerase sigma factor (sigma-70 family)
MSVQNKETNHRSSFRQSSAYSKWTDSQLVTACQNREQLAFACLRNRHLRLVGSVLYRLAPEQRDTDDLLQEIFLKVWNSIGNLRNPLVFRSWLHQVITNCFYDDLRRRSRRTFISLDCPIESDEGIHDVFRQIADSAPQPDEVAESTEMAEQIQSSLVHLAPTSRRIILLRLDGLSYTQIAQLTKTELGTVKSRLCRARTKLKTLLQQPRAA